MQPKAKETFCVMYADGEPLKKCAEAAGVRVGAIGHELNRDPAFQAALDAARVVRGLLAEDEAYQRAVNGREDDGKRRSDPLLQKVLASLQPDRFGDKTTVTHKGTVEILDGEQLAKARQLGRDEGLMDALQQIADRFSQSTAIEAETRLIEGGASGKDE